MKKNVILELLEKLKIFSITDLDSHYIILLFGHIQISIKHKCKFKYQKAVEYGVTAEKRETPLIVSLTSFPARIKSVDKTINTLLRQRLKPDKVVLWLANEQFPQGRDELPKELLDLEKLGLEIKWCEDLRSYKKLVPSIREYPNAVIVTADDDVYYEDDWLESLYNAHLAHPGTIIVRRGVRIEFDGKKFKPLTARKSKTMDMETPSYLNQVLGCAGCLYPPGSLYPDILKPEKFMKLAPTHDDLFFWAMAVLNRTKIMMTVGYKATIYSVENTQDVALKDVNVTDLVDKIYCEMSQEYPELINIINEELKVS